MNIEGLENNYYLCQNDIWITVNGFTEEVSYLEVSITNGTTGKSLPIFRMSPSPNNEFKFNICIPVRSLFPFPDHGNINSLQGFRINFMAKFKKLGDVDIPDENQSISKYFVLGGRNKNGKDEWHLTSSAELIVGKWLEWPGITLPGFAKRIQGDVIVDFVPTDKLILNTPKACDYRILKFLNSLGGYQFYVFEKYEEKTKSKAGKTISRITGRLRQDNFRNIEVEAERTIELQTKTPWEAQGVITDLICSPEVLLYHPNGDDNDSRWQRLVIENNDSLENNWEQVYNNTIEFSFSKYINKTI